MNYNKAALFILLTVALYWNKSSSMEPKDTNITSAPLIPLFYLVHTDSQLTYKINDGNYFVFPKPAHHFIHPEMYAKAFGETIATNLVIAQKNGINEKSRARYARRLIAEKYCTEYNMKTVQYNRLYPSNQHNPLLPDFHPVYSTNDMAEYFSFNENTKFYSYPKPANASIDIPFYKRTMMKTLKINISLAHDRGLDNDRFIKPYTARILSLLEWTMYNLEIAQNSLA